MFCGSFHGTICVNQVITHTHKERGGIHIGTYIQKDKGEGYMHACIQAHTYTERKRKERYMHMLLYIERYTYAYTHAHIHQTHIHTYTHTKRERDSRL